MSGHGAVRKVTPATRALQAAALAFVFAVPLAAQRLAPSLDGPIGAAAGCGFLLLAGALLSELLEIIGLPHLSGYLLAGIIGGPHLLHIIDHATVDALQLVNTLALALIALAGGAELEVATLRRVLRSLGYATLVQSVVVLACMAGVFMLLSSRIPFAQGMAPTMLLGVALLWGVMSVSRSPSACLGVLAQTRAKGPLATFSLAFIMTSDVVVVVLLAVVLACVRPLLDPSGEFSLSAFSELGHEVLGSVSLGTTLGLVLAAYLRLVGRQFLLVLLALGFGMTEALRYVRFEPLLCFLSAGFVVRNLSQQGEKLLAAVTDTGTVVFVVFFATAGAHLDLPLLRSMAAIAFALAGARALATALAARIACRLAGDDQVLRTWSWSSLVSQAGLTIGLGVTIGRTFPAFGEAFRSLVVATVAINEMIGPVLFKFALDRTGESGAGGGGDMELELPKPTA